MENAFADLAAQLSSEIEFEFEKGLIVSVRSYRCLFAINHEQYHNTVHNKVAWQQISNCLKKSVLDCINRWYTLVQTFLYYYQKSLSSKEPITWPHYDALQELRPAMVTEYTDLIETKKPPIFYAKSNATQREELLNELIANRLKLLSSETPIEQVQKIWATLADKLNNMGPRMPIIKWQRCWWEMKTRFKKQIWQIQMRQQSKVGSRLTEFLSEEDMKIMKFCGANVLHSYSSSIAVVLDSYIEFGSNRDKPIPRCRKCTIFLKDVTCDLCDACLKFPNKCDICLQMFELELVFYQLKDWSLKAKSLLPTSYHTYAELAMCTNCSDALQKESATTWKVCRVCEKNHQVLDNLFSSTNDHLRDVFRKATNITFYECQGLPGYICNICKVQMHQFNNFYLRFCRAQSRLKEIHATKFIDTDWPEEEEKSSNPEKPVTYLLKRDTAATSTSTSTSSINSMRPSKPTYLLNPEIISGPVLPNPPYNIHSNVPQIKRFTKMVFSNKGGTARIADAGPTIQRVYLAKSRAAPVATERPKIPGVAPAKRMCIGPTNTKGVVSLQPVASASQPIPVKIITVTPSPATGVLKVHPGSASVVTPSPIATQVCAVPSGHAPVPLFPTKNTGVTITKRINATPPAVFTIAGDNPQELPPAFCITKSLNAAQLSMLPPVSVERLSGLSKIKTEKLDDGYPTPAPNKNDSPSDVSSNASTVSAETTYSRAPVLRYGPPKTINELQRDGSTVVLKSKQAKYDGIIPLSTNPHHAFHNVFLNANKDIFQPKKTKSPSPEPIIETDNKKLPTRKCPPNPPVLNVTEEQRQQQQQQPRVRKYWGPVDEFQITSMSEKTNAITKSNPQSEQFAAPPVGIIPEVEVKKERIDNQPSMFYPDSFELNSASIDADVSLMINAMMTKQEPIDESFKYINPSFLISYAENQAKKDTPERKEHQEKTSSKRPNDTPAESNKSKKDTAKADEVASKESSTESASEEVPVKNVRVKLKRSDRLKKLASRKRKRTYQPPKSIPTRKSLRKLKSQTAK